MDDESTRRVRRWMALEKEEGADEAESDHALGALMELVPPPAPPAGFDRRVIRAVRRTTVAGDRRALSHPARTMGRAGVVGIGAVALAYVGIVRLVPLAVSGFIRVLEVLAQGCLWIALSLNAGIDMWTILAAAGRAIGVAAATPQVSGGLVVMAMAGALALYGLQRLLTSEEESSRW